MEKAKPYDTLMSFPVKLDLDESGKKVAVTLFRGMIGSLLYLIVSRPDIIFSIRMCAHFQSNPKKSHLIAIKRFLRYLNGTPNLGL